MTSLGTLTLDLKLDDSGYRRSLAAARRQAEDLDRLFRRPITLDFNTRGSARQLRTVSTQFSSFAGQFRNPLDIRINTDPALRAIRGLASAADTILTGAFLRVGSIITDTIANAIGSVVDTIAAIPGQAVGEFVDFEAGLNQLSVVTRSTREELEGVVDATRQLGIETSKAPAEVISAANALATLGLNAQQVEDALPAVVALSEATASSLDLSADLIAKAGNVFGTGFEDAADVITTLRNTSAAIPQDVTFLLQNAGAVAKSVGLDFDELSVAFATLRDAGQNARPAATGLRNVLQNLSPVTDTAQAALEQLGLSLIDAESGEFLGFESFINQLQGSRQRFIDSGQGLEAFNQQLTILFGREGVTTALTLLDQADDAFAKNQANLANVAGASAESAQGLQQGLSGALQLLRGTVDTLLISFGEGLAPALEAFVRILTRVGNEVLSTEGLFQPLIDSAEGLRDLFLGGQLDGAIENFAQAIVQLAASGLGRIADLFDLLASRPDLITQAFNRVIGAIQTFVGIAGTIARVGVALVNITSIAIDRFGPAIVTSFQLVSRAVAGLIDVFQSLFSGISGAGFSQILDPLQATFQNLFALFSQNANPITDFAQSIGELLSVALVEVVQIIEQLSEVLLNNSAAFGLFFGGATGVIGFVASLTPNLSELVDILLQAGLAVADFAGRVVGFFVNQDYSGIIEPLRNAFSNIFQLFSDNSSQIGEFGAAIGTLLIAAFQELAEIIEIVAAVLAENSGLFGSLLEGNTGIVEFITGLVSGLSDFVGFIVSIGEKIGEVFGNIINFFANQDFSGVIESLRAAFQSLLDAFGNLRAAFADSSESVEAFNSAGQNLGVSFGDLLVSVITELGELLAFMVESLAGFVNLLAENPDVLRSFFEGTATIVDGLAVAITALADAISLIVEGIEFAADGLQSLVAQANNIGGAVLGGPAELLSNITGRFTGGPVGPGTVYSVAEKGPEIGVFGGKSVLFREPAILPSPPRGMIFNAAETSEMLSQDMPSIIESAPAMRSVFVDNSNDTDTALLRDIKAMLSAHFRSPMIGGYANG